MLFIALKLTGVIDWSWWWVLSPLAVYFTIPRNKRFRRSHIETERDSFRNQVVELETRIEAVELLIQFGTMDAETVLHYLNGGFGPHRPE